MASMREFQCTITADQREHKVSHLKKKKILMIPETFGKTFCGVTRKIYNFVEGLSCITSAMQSVNKGTIMRTSYQQ